MPEETERTVVRTYVPAYQKEEWAEAAADLEMSQSEFVRTMVQAGRRDFDIPAREPETESADNPEGPAETDTTPGVDGVETRIIDVLENRGPLSWDEVVRELSRDLEDRVEDCLQRLQRQGSVRYSGRDGGYVLTDE